jgi:hypothetical protein
MTHKFDEVKIKLFTNALKSDAEYLLPVALERLSKATCSRGSRKLANEQ